MLDTDKEVICLDPSRNSCVPLIQEDGYGPQGIAWVVVGRDLRPGL